MEAPVVLEPPEAVVGEDDEGGSLAPQPVELLDRVRVVHGAAPVPAVPFEKGHVSTAGDDLPVSPGVSPPGLVDEDVRRPLADDAPDLVGRAAEAHHPGVVRIPALPLV